MSFKSAYKRKKDFQRRWSAFRTNKELRRELLAKSE